MQDGLEKDKMKKSRRKGESRMRRTTVQGVTLLVVATVSDAWTNLLPRPGGEAVPARPLRIHYQRLRNDALR
jgi:hypothetical protein